MLPEKIGNYRIVRLIGEGGMGRVYEAIQDQIQRRAAIKVLHAQFAHNSEAYTRFLNEARAVNIVQHPGVVSIYEFGQTDDGSPYIVMEYLDGESLSSRLARLGFMSLGALRIARQIASALVAAHAKHIVHRDLKPSNVMLIPDPDMPGGERVKVVDFGIAKLKDEQSSGGLKTRAGAILGTPTYMAPEQCRGAGEVNEKSDIYSLGVVFYEMLTGRPPFVADGEGEVMGMHMFKAPPPLHSLMPTLPLDLVNLVHSMLAKSPDERPTMVEVARELDRIGQRMSGPLHAAEQELAAQAAEPKPPGPKTLPLEGSGAPAPASAQPTEAAPPSPAAEPPTVPPAAAAEPPKEAARPTAVIPPPSKVAPAAPSQDIQPGQVSGQVGAPARGGSWLRFAIPSAVLVVAIAGVTSFAVLRRQHRQAPTRFELASGSRQSAPVPAAPPVANEPAAPTVATQPAAPMVATQPAPPMAGNESAAAANPAAEAGAPIEKPAEVAAGGAEANGQVAKPVKGAKSDKILQLGEEYIRTGKWNDAFNLLSTWGATSVSPTAARRMSGIAACHLKNAAAALDAYEKLEGSDRKAVAQACRLSGVSIPDEELRDAEALLVQKRWAEALAAAQAPKIPLPRPHRAWRVIGLAACHLQSFAQAKEALAHVDAKDHAALVAACQAEGIQLEPKGKSTGKPVIF